MTPDLSQWTIVVVGQWNPHIFSPQWVGTNLFKAEEVETEILVGAVGGPTRFTVGNLVLLPARDRLVAGVKNPESLEDAERLIKNAVELLGHTPVHALGINFGFSINDPDPDVLALFNLPDTRGISDAGCDVLGAEITRRLSFGDKLLNLTFINDAGAVKIHANFHYAVPSTKAAAEKLAGNAIACRDQLLRLLQSVYQLTLD